jgi:hypothetical protein
MKVEFLSKYSREIDLLAHKSDKAKLLKLIQLIEVSKSLFEIPKLKKYCNQLEFFATYSIYFRYPYFRIPPLPCALRSRIFSSNSRLNSSSDLNNFATFLMGRTCLNRG